MKKRLVVDYSLTINRFTYLDAYPLPHIEDLVNKVATYKFFSTIDLQSAYHCIPLHPDDKIYTAFEADGRLYQFTRLSFGLTNGVSSFQRIIADLITKSGLKGTYAYLDDVTICGKTQEEHDRNLERFMEMARKYRLTFNSDKCTFSKKVISLLGYEVKHQELRPDPARLEPLLRMPEPTSPKSLARLVGLFAYYSKWIPSFSSRIRPLIKATLPLSNLAKTSITTLKNLIANSVRTTIKDSEPLSIETDASDTAIAATLSQNGRPIAFYSRTLQHSEQHHCSVEKEAYAIVEAVRKWRHFLLGRDFTLITDQRSVSFMFDGSHSSKIKNEKIARWRLELMPYRYTIIYRAGKLNAAADALSRANYLCSSSLLDELFELHSNLCHPGTTRILECCILFALGTCLIR